ncbi:alpha/beta hydrolase, partial [Streptomyces sp. NPDC056387]|uniref:alpha/beta hydrolase n=1 Tax=Streptomyces sp. NPDC056387 TaxID=3345803 RepID=UPI0035D5C461
MSARRTPVPFDPELRVALDALDEEVKAPITPETLAARQRRDAASRPRPTAEDLRADGRFEVTELRVPGPPDAPDLTLVSARPSGLTGPLPLLYYMHGGGMVMGNAWSVLPGILREWAHPLNLAVLSVEYRLAPQARYPEPLEDCYAGLLWAAAHAAELGIDADRIVIGGKSAGGGLAAALALLA